MKIFLRPVLIAFAGFFLGCIADEVFQIETRLGLDALFQLRGIRKPPDDVVIVAIDEDSDKEFGIGTNFTEWRGKHAGLIKALQAQNAALIVFDFYFSAAQPEVDPALAKAMRDSKRVIAGDCIQTEKNGWGLCGKKPIPTQAVQIYPPIPVLADALLDHGPFFLGDDAGNFVVRQSWTFLGDKPTIPVLAWFHTLNKNKGLDNIVQPTFPLSHWLSEQRKQCTLLARDTDQLKTEKPSFEIQIQQLTCRGDSRFLDFYGPPQTLRMESYSAVREGRINDLQGKIVFVGQVPRKTLPGVDSFVTPTTSTSSGKMAGVEVMATQFANLLEGRETAPPIPLGFSMALFALTVSFLLTSFPWLSGIIASLILSSIYLASAVFLFKQSAMWLPIATPLLLEFPIALLFSLSWSYWDQIKARERLEMIIKEITTENLRLINKITDPVANPNFLSNLLPREGSSEKIGVCLATDIEGYTELAQRIPTHILFNILRDYYKELGTVVSSCGGKISNIAGDGMIAIWIDQPINYLKESACKAAIQSEMALSRFNETLNGERLTTRFGLHMGDFTIGSLGDVTSDDNPIGYDVNVASRIEGANKILGTKILASSSVVVGLPSVKVRPVGKFLLKGMAKPIDLSVIEGNALGIVVSNRLYNKLFVKGLAAVQRGQWQRAEVIFYTLLSERPDDGPTKYYLEVAKTCQQSPPKNWAGYINLESNQSN